MLPNVALRQNSIIEEKLRPICEDVKVCLCVCVCVCVCLWVSVWVYMCGLNEQL